jgi:hypothetical protein
MTNVPSFRDADGIELVGYHNQAEFDAAVAEWDAAHADDPNPFTDEVAAFRNEVVGFADEHLWWEDRMNLHLLAEWMWETHDRTNIVPMLEKPWKYTDSFVDAVHAAVVELSVDFPDTTFDSLFAERVSPQWGASR